VLRGEGGDLADESGHRKQFYDSLERQAQIYKLYVRYHGHSIYEISTIYIRAIVGWIYGYMKQDGIYSMQIRALIN
jgi:hypothetical protein